MVMELTDKPVEEKLKLNEALGSPNEPICRMPKARSVAEDCAVASAEEAREPTAATFLKLPDVFPHAVAVVV